MSEPERYRQAIVLVVALALALALVAGPNGDRACAQAPPAASPSRPERPVWRAVRDPGVPGLELGVRDLAVGPLGSIWVATARGLVRSAGEGFQRVHRSDLLSQGQVWKLAATRRGVIAATRGGLVWFDELAPTLAGRRVGEGAGAGEGKGEREATLVFVHDGQFWSFRPRADQKVQSIAIEGQSPASGFIVHATRRQIRLRDFLPGGPGRLLGRDARLGWLSIDGTMSDQPLPPSLPADVQAALSLPHGTLVLAGGRTFVLDAKGQTRPADAPGWAPRVLAHGRDPAHVWLVGDDLARELQQADRDVTVVRTVVMPATGGVTAFAQDAAGRLWAGSSTGLWMSDPDGTRAAPLPPVSRVPDSAAARALAPSGTLAVLPPSPPPEAGFAPDGSIWIGRAQQTQILDPLGYPGARAEVSQAGTLIAIDEADCQSPIAAAFFGATSFIQTRDSQILRVDPSGCSRTGIETLYPTGLPTLLAAQDDLLVLGVAQGDAPGMYQRIETYRTGAGAGPGSGSAAASRVSFGLRQGESAVLEVEPAERPGEFYVTRAGVASGATAGASASPGAGAATMTIARLDRDDGLHELPLPPPDTERLGTPAGLRGIYFSAPPADAGAGPGNLGPGSGALFFADSARILRWDGSAGWRETLRLAAQPETMTTVWGVHAYAHATEVLCGSSRGFGVKKQFIIRAAGGGGGEHPAIEVHDPERAVADNGAMAYDDAGRLWAFTPAGVYRRDRLGDPFARVSPAPPPPGAAEWSSAAARVHPGTFLHEKGRVWIATYPKVAGSDMPIVPTTDTRYEADAALWLIEGEKPPRRIESAQFGTRWVNGCELFPDEQGDRIWLGGDGFLFTIDPATLEKRDRLDLMRPVGAPVGSPVPYVWELGRDGDGLLVLTSTPELLRLQPAGARLAIVPVPVPGLADLRPRFGVVECLPHGRAVLNAFSDGLTQVWYRPGPGAAFLPGKGPSWTITTAADADADADAGGSGGDALLGTYAGMILAIDSSGQIRLRHDLLTPVQPDPVKPLRSVTAMAGGTSLWLVDGFWRLYRRDGDGPPERITSWVPPWEQCALLRNGSLLTFSGTPNRPGRIRLPAPVGALIERPRYNSDPPPLEFSRFQRDPRTGVVWMIAGNERVAGPSAPAGSPGLDLWLWRFDEKNDRFERVAELPPEDRRGDPMKLTLGLDSGGVWIGTDRYGLWRLDIPTDRADTAGTPVIAAREWKPWDTTDGLASNQVQAIACRGPREAVVFTQGGRSAARADADGEWAFTSPPPEGLTSGRVRATLVVRIAATTILAIGTDRGIDLAWLPAPGDGTGTGKARAAPAARWSHLSTGDGLADDDVRVLRWCAARHELWAGTATGVTVFPFDPKRLDPNIHPSGVIAIDPLPGLDTQPVADLTVSRSGDDAWFLTGSVPRDAGDSLSGRGQEAIPNPYIDLHSTVASLVGTNAAGANPPFAPTTAAPAPAPALPPARDPLPAGIPPHLSRWSRARRQVVCTSELALLTGTTAARLGPAPGEAEAPRVLFRGGGDDWAVLDPTPAVNLRLKVDDWAFFVVGSLSCESLAPERVATGSSWRARYAVDRVGDRMSGSRILLHPDLFEPGFYLGGGSPAGTEDPESHVLIAEITLAPLGGRPAEHRYATAIIHRPSPGLRIIRGLLLLAGAAGVVTLAAWSVLRRREQIERLRRQEIPYIEGEPILLEEKFFGRAALLKNLVDSLKSGSRALVGPWRIGKTSLQHQLARRLEALADPAYVYLPFFVDMADFQPEQHHFFAFLAQHLVALARKHQVPPEVMDGLECAQLDSDSEDDYDSLALKLDLQALVNHWRHAFAPRAPLVVFQIDEVQNLRSQTALTLRQFRSLFTSELAPYVKTVLSGRLVPRDEDLKGEETTAGSPWANFIGEVIEVEPLTPAEARKLIVEPVRGLFHFDKDVVERIEARGQGLPFELQKLCAGVLRYKYRQAKRGWRWSRITGADLEASLQSGPDRGETSPAPSPE
jgi:hypothetical protein